MAPGAAFGWVDESVDKSADKLAVVWADESVNELAAVWVDESADERLLCGLMCDESADKRLLGGLMSRLMKGCCVG